MEIQRIEISPICLQWTDWYPWCRFLLDARSDPSSISLPNDAGVYEVKFIKS